MNNLYDLLIIGAGPAGLSAAIEAQKAGLSYLVVDKGSIVDSIQRFQRDMFFFSTPELLEIGNIPFVISTVRPTSLDCVNYYRRVADTYRLQCSFYHHITSAVKSDGAFLVKSAKEATFSARAMVVATGYYDDPNSLHVQGEHLPHVSHYYHDPLPWYRCNVLIVGGKNSAVEAGLDLWRHGANVTVVHRGEALSGNVKYWILPDFQNRVADGSITMHFQTVVKQFHPDHALVERGGKETFRIKTDGVFILIGYHPNVQFLKSLGIQVDADTLAPAFNPETMETNVENLFVAGGMVGGRFNNKVFIENGREHGKKIVTALVKKLESVDNPVPK